jgi:hypothetical protein
VTPEGCGISIDCRPSTGCAACSPAAEGASSRPAWDLVGERESAEGEAMRKKLVLVGVGLLGLGGAGLALANGGPNTTVTAVSATFTATAASGRTDTRTCTTTDGKTLVSTHSTYTGTASSASPELSGPITLDTRSLIDTSDDVGRVDAHVRFAGSSGRTDLRFSGVYDHGNLAGLATGHAGAPHVQLVGNLSSAFSTGGGYTSGKLGGPSAGGSAIELGPGRCAPNRPAPPKPKPVPPAKPHPQTAEASGAISSVSSGSITVAGLTCTVPASLAARVGGLKTGDQARIRCTLANGTATLSRIDARH